MTCPGAFAAALVAGLLSCGLLAGCTPATPVLSDEVTVMAHQPRTDIAHGRLAIQVRNGTDEPLEVVGARLSSPDFVADTIWPNDSATVPAGLALDLRAPLPEVRCDADTRPVATIEFVAGDALGLTELDVEPTGAPGVVRLDAVGGTTLLLPAAAGQASDLLDLGISIDADGPLEVRIPFVPNRCDPHALMEDKVGTIIPLYVTTATTDETRWMLPVTDAQRADFYAFFATYCGLPTLDAMGVLSLGPPLA